MNYSNVRREEVMSIIDTLRQGWYTPPATYYKKKIEFEMQSYQCSALKEIKYYLIEHKEKTPIEAIDDFRHMVDKFSYNNSKNKNVVFMYSTYYDVATDVLDVLLNVNKEG